MEEKFMKKLTPRQHKVLVGKGTEFPFTGKLLKEKRKGVYACAACGNVLFKSDHKFDSKSGWPSFYDLAKKGSVKLKDASYLWMKFKEVSCAKCGGHLGHLFDDGPRDKTGKRYCINSCALDFKEKK